MINGLFIAFRVASERWIEMLHKPVTKDQNQVVS